MQKVTTYMLPKNTLNKQETHRKILYVSVLKAFIINLLLHN